VIPIKEQFIVFQSVKEYRAVNGLSRQIREEYISVTIAIKSLQSLLFRPINTLSRACLFMIHLRSPMR